MSNSDRPTRSKPRKESGIHGKHYERKIFALTALKCVLDPNIKDFWLLSNPSEIEKFDDIILSTEYKNGEKNLFFVQIKHRLQGTDRPIVAGKLDGTDKDLSLKMYEKSFLDIKENKDFFETHRIREETDLFFILFNNCKVTTEKENMSTSNDNITFDFGGDGFEFIDTSKEKNNIFKITNKTDKYDENFLDRFYFYTKQINEELVINEIANVLGVNEDTVKNNILNVFYLWLEQKDYCMKLTKFDIKTRLLDMLFADFRQPPWNLNSVRDFKLINVISKFNATIITEENSSIMVWNEILHRIQHYCEDPLLNLTTWEDIIPPDLVEEKFTHFKEKETLLMNNTNVNVKFVYLYLVIQRKIPFCITTNNRLFDSFKNKLLRGLDIYSVVYNVRKECINFPDTTRVFQNLNDLDPLLYHGHSEKLKISFQGKSDNDLYKLIEENNTTMGRKFSVDHYIKLLHEKCTFGEERILPKYYINREIFIPVVKKEILNQKEFNFLIFQYPKRMKILGNVNLKFYNFLISVFGDIYSDQSQSIITTPDEFDITKLNLMQRFLKGRDYYIFKYINEDYFLLLDSNGSIEHIRPFVIYVKIQDMELYKINKGCPINIICNNTGMGKSTFLTFLNSNLPKDEWVIHIDLKKFSDHIKTIKTIDELISFSYNCQRKGVNESFCDFFENLYKDLKHKVLWLIDDYEEVSQPILLDFFKLASRQGFKIWIVARPFLKSEFENVFGVFSMELTRFSIKDQRNFAKKYLQAQNKTKEEIKSITAAIRKTTRLLEDSFIGTCQQMMMLTEIFLNYNTNGNEQKWVVHDIYEKFINLKISDNDQMQKEWYRRWYLRTISKLALKVFFTDEILKTVIDLEEFEEDVNMFRNNYPKDFFISEFTKEGVPIFNHKTYAEFLAARWLLHTVSKQMLKKTPFDISDIFRLLHLKELTAVRRFFDNMITKDIPSLCASVNGEIMNKSITNECFYETDLIGRSVCHLAASYGHYFDIGITTKTANSVRNLDVHSQVVQEGQFMVLKPIGSIVSNKLTANVKEYLQKLSFVNQMICISREDTLLKLNPIDYALISGSLLELDALLNIKNSAVNQSVLTPLPHEMKYCLLFHSIRNNLHNIFASLDLKGLNNIKINPLKGTFLHLAINSKNVEAVKKLIEHHCFEEWGVDNQGNTPLHTACNQKDNFALKCFSNLVKEVDANFLNRKNVKGQSYLHFLAARGHTRWIKRIAKVTGVDIDSEDCNGNTPFLQSIRFSKIHVAIFLQSRGADINHTNLKKMTALHFAAMKGYIKCVKELLLWKMDVNAKDYLGQTPLMKAVYNGHKNVVTLLISKKAKLNSRDKNQASALHHAVKRNNIEIIQLLLKCKADGNVENKIKETPLTIACKNNFVQATKVLLDHHVTYGGKEAFEISHEYKHKECMDLLLQAGIGL